MYFKEAGTLKLTDIYKLGHMVQYNPAVTKVYSYLEAREKNKKLPFFGLQYYLYKYLSQPITHENVERLVYLHKRIIGSCPTEIEAKLTKLADLGYWPVKIKAVPEGSLVDTQNILISIESTHKDFYWCPGFLESLLLKVWNTCTVAACSVDYYNLVKDYAEQTCDDLSHLPYAVHDFGYRGVSSEETAELSGAAHLLAFLGSDTISAIDFLDKWYTPQETTPIGLSVPASEHSVMCSFGRDNEFAAIDHMLDIYPTGIVSVVSDTYDLWNVLENYTRSRYDIIVNRDGKTVFRPDSGDPVKIVCGDPNAPQGTPERLGALQILWNVFGGTKNTKGYKVLNPKIGLIYGDGMHYKRFIEMLETMKQLGFASSNLVIGVGGLLLQQHNRDEYKFAIKASSVTLNGDTDQETRMEIYKDPITDNKKKSKKGLMKLKKINGKYITLDQQEDTFGGELITVFENGEVLKHFTLEEVRDNLMISLNS